MSDDPGQLESQLLALKESMERLEARVADLESSVGGSQLTASLIASESAGTKADPAASVVAVDVTGETDRIVQDSEPEEESAPTLTEMVEEAGANIGAGLIGAILLVLAGAYLLRALSEGDVLAGVLGVACGLAYAFAWAVICHLLGKRGRRGAASASGLAACMVALPMIWESTARFELLDPWIAGLLLIVVGAILLPIAARYRLGPVSAAAVLGIGCTSLVLMFGTHRPEPFALTLGMLGIAAIFVGPRRGGPLPWLGYCLANLGVFLLIAWAHGERAIAFPIPTVAILIGYFVATIVIIVFQSRRIGELGPHQFFQGTHVTLLGYGGALLVAGERLPTVAMGLAAGGVIAGMAGYAFLLVTFRSARHHRWAFFLLSSIAVGVVAMGSWVLFPHPVWLFSGFAVLLAGAGVRLDRVSPGFHAAMAILFAVVAGELGGVMLHALAFPGSSPWPDLALPAIATLAAAVVCSLLPFKVHSPVWPDWLPRLGRGAVILMAVLGIDAVMIQLAAPLLAGDPGSFDAGNLAALRTAILAASVVVLAALSRYQRLQPAARLIWPLLAAIALKLLVEDFPRGRAITMALSFLFYGVALIMATWLLRVSKNRES